MIEKMNKQIFIYNHKNKLNENKFYLLTKTSIKKSKIKKDYKKSIWGNFTMDNFHGGHFSRAGHFSGRNYFP